MKLLVLSDLHTEFGDFNPPEADADIVVLAGDIGVGTTGIALTTLSPITAIPAAILLLVVLTIVNSVPVDAGSLVFSATQVMKSVLSNAFLIQLAVLDLVIRGFLLTGPLLLTVGVGAAKWADRSGCYWRRLIRASVLVGALYPSIFIVASTMGWFDEPFFN